LRNFTFSHFGTVPDRQMDRVCLRDRQTVILRLHCYIVTDRQTDGLTHDDSIYRASIASRGKNGPRDSDHAPFRVVCHS